MLLSQTSIAALLATGIISLAPNLILFLFPSFGNVDESNSSQGKAILSIGQAIAAGGLLGDVFLHTLPHAMASVAAAAESPHDDDVIKVGQFVLVGFCAFLVLDGMIRVLGEGHSHSSSTHDHGHNHSHQNGSTNNCVNKGNGDETRRKLTSTLILNLAADALHNFTDGLAIGTSFALSSINGRNATISSILQSQGGIASLSVLFHEIPHELGDYSILISSGFTKYEAIASQFITAIAAFLGTIFGLYISRITVDSHHEHEIHDYGIHEHDHTNGSQMNLLSFTSGGFVYLAACGILPDLLNQSSCSTKVRCLQLLAFCAGIAFMQLVAVMESDHEHEHIHHHEL